MVEMTKVIGRASQERQQDETFSEKGWQFGATTIQGGPWAVSPAIIVRTVRPDVTKSPKSLKTAKMSTFLEKCFNFGCSLLKISRMKVLLKLMAAGEKPFTCRLPPS